MNPDTDLFDTLGPDTQPIGEIPADGDLMKEEKTRIQSHIPAIFQQYGTPQRIGRGSSSVVFRLGSDHILKLMECGTNEERREAARNELKTMELLRGTPGTVQLIDGILSHVEDGWQYMLLEPYYIPLTEYIRTHPFQSHHVAALGIALCQTMERLQKKGFLHLDIQPKNIYTDRDGTFLLGDFGSALNISELEHSKYLRGTKAYMAPEVYAAQKYSIQSEIYSIGLVLYTLLNHGSLPLMDAFTPEEAVERRLSGEAIPPLSDPLWPALQTALFRDPAERFGSYADFEAALKASLHMSPPNETGNNSFEGFEEFDAEPFAMTCLLDGELASAPMHRSASFSMEKKAPAPRLPVSAPMHRSAPFPLEEKAPAPRLPVSAPMPGNNTGQTGEKKSGQGFLGRLISKLIRKQNNLPDAAMQEPSFSRLPAEAGKLFDGHSDLSFTEPHTSPRLSKVEFSAVFPQHFLKGQFSILEVIMYEEEFRRIVDETIAAAGTAAKEVRGSVLEAAENTVVSVHLECMDKSVEIDGNDEPQKWLGKYLKFSFSIFLNKDYPGNQLPFKLSVYFNGVIAARLRFTADCNVATRQKLTLVRNNINSAFVSYSREDQNRVVSMIQGIRTARPDMDIFFDLDSIHTGEYWEKVLKDEIYRRDILYLCWSRAASRSEWVSKEWHYALENKGLDSIEPIAVESPDLCPPPNELASKHFNDRMLYFLKS